MDDRPLWWGSPCDKEHLPTDICEHGCWTEAANEKAWEVALRRVARGSVDHSGHRPSGDPNTQYERNIKILTKYFENKWPNKVRVKERNE